MPGENEIGMVKGIAYLIGALIGIFFAVMFLAGTMSCAFKFALWIAKL